MNADNFWSRESLEHVLFAARSRRVSPWAVLGCTLARATATIPPTVALPATVGSRMSCNLFIALVGPSAGGKGAAEAVAAEAVQFTNCAAVPVVPLGSGEGVASTFRPPDTKPDEPNPVTTALISTPEIDTMTALTNRQGSTLSAELRKMWSGETLGFGNAGKDTRRIVAAHSYRACLVAGVQPLRAGPLLSAADGGLPQRFLWMPTDDQDAPDTPIDWPGARTVRAPAWHASSTRHLSVVGAGTNLTIPEIARREIDAHRLAVLRGAPGVDPLDGHALLCQLKTAAALTALDGRTIVNDEDWHLAGVLMAVSKATRERCRRAITEQARAANQARAHAAAEREEIGDDRRLQRTREAIERWLVKVPADGWLPRRDLLPKIKANLRGYFDEALAQLIESGRVAEKESERGRLYCAVPRYSGTAQPSTSENNGCTNAVPVQPNNEISLGETVCGGCGKPLGATGKCAHCIAQMHNEAAAQQTGEATA